MNMTLHILYNFVHTSSVTTACNIIKSSTCDMTESHTSNLTELSTSYETDQPTFSLRGSSHQICDIEQLQRPFPNFPPQFISDLYMISRCNFTATLECLLEGNLSCVLILEC